MNSNIDTVEIYALGKRIALIKKDDIRSAFPENDDRYIDSDWDTACRFLSAYVGNDGVCRLELDSVLDGNTVDLSKNIAVFMIFTALMRSGMMREIPPQTAFRAIPYISSRMAFAELNMAKIKKMEGFVPKASAELEKVVNDEISIDDAFENILGCIPSVENYSSVSGQDKERYLPFFEMLLEKSRLCADPGYQDIIEKYVDALS